MLGLKLIHASKRGPIYESVKRLWTMFNRHRQVGYVEPYFECDTMKFLRKPISSVLCVVLGDKAN